MAPDDEPGPGAAADGLLADLADRLRVELAASASVEVSEFLDGRGIDWHLRPTNPRSAPVQWMTLGDDLIIQAGALFRGGRWELERTPEDVAFVEAVVRATIAGRVVESSALARSRVAVTLEDGRVVRETGYEGCLSVLVPLPGWPYWGRISRYEPYASPRGD